MLTRDSGGSQLPGIGVGRSSLSFGSTEDILMQEINLIDKIPCKLFLVRLRGAQRSLIGPETQHTFNEGILTQQLKLYVKMPLGHQFRHELLCPFGG